MTSGPIPARIVGRLSSIWRYPVKSMAGESLNSCMLAATGIPGDRGWAIWEKKSLLIGSAKRLHSLMLYSASYLAQPHGDDLPDALITSPSGWSGRAKDPETARRLSEDLGREVLLRAKAGAHFDDKPLHVLSIAALRTLERSTGSRPFDPRRFRANFLIDTDESQGAPELSWPGKTLRVGRCAIRVVKPTKRCVMTTLPQKDLPKDPEVLRAIVREARNNLGVYAEIVEPGLAAVGDEVRLLP